MEYREQVKKLNETLRDRASGLKGSDIAMKSDVRQPTISNWLRGMDCGVEPLCKIAYALGMKIEIILKQDWEGGERDGLGEK